jgi:hypothetical protein
MSSKDMEAEKPPPERDGPVAAVSVVGGPRRRRGAPQPAGHSASRRVATKERIQQAADQFFGGDYAAAAKSFTDKGYEIQ